jgi:outer membrane cobalamin receptor
MGKHALLLMSIFLMAISSNTLHAEEENDNINFLVGLSLEELLSVEINVGSLFKENRFTSGATTELFTREEWQNSTSKDVWEVINHQPGVMIPINSVGGKGISVRGILLDPGVRGIATLIDGIPINNLSYSTGLYHLENPGLGILDKVEMLRGPGSSIYGADAFQGVVSFSTLKYTEDKTEVQGTAGLDDYYQQSFNYGKRLSDKVTLSIAADNSSKREEIDYEYGPGPGRLNPERTEKGSLTEPIETTSFAATLNAQLTNKLNIETGVIGNISSRETLRYAQSDKLSIVDQDSSFGLIRTTALYDLDDNTTLNAKGYYWRGEVDWFFTDSSFIINNTNTSSGFDANIKQENEKYNTKWALGYSYSYTEIDEAETGRKPTVSPDFVEGYTREVNSLYLDARTSFWDGSVDVLYGARFDSFSDFGDHTSPRLGLIYYPNASSAIKLTYSNAFRSPAANEIGTNPSASTAATFGNASLDPETLDTYEIVYMKSSGQSHFEGTLFYTELTDGIVSAPMPASDPQFSPGRNQYQNVAGVRSKGIEAKFSTVIKDVKSELSASWVSSETSEGGFKYDGFPNWIINGKFTYELPQHSTTFTLDNRIELSRKTFQRTNLSQHSTDLDDYYRADLNITKTYGKELDLSLNVTNLFDNDDLHAVSARPNETLISQPGRSFFARLRYKW